MIRHEGQPRRQRRFVWFNMFVHPDDGPRADGGWRYDQRAVLLGSLADRRLNT